MIWHDNGFGITQESLKFFRVWQGDIGPIVGVTMLNFYQDDDWIKYPFRIVGETGEIWLSGCNAGYSHGEHPQGSVTVLKELGYPEPYCDWPLSKVEFELGPPGGPEIPVEPLPQVELTEAHEEVLEVLEAYHRKHGKMPTVRELAELCGLSTHNAVWRRLDELEVAGKIRRERYKARGIEVLI